MPRTIDGVSRKEVLEEEKREGGGEEGRAVG